MTAVSCAPRLSKSRQDMLIEQLSVFVLADSMNYATQMNGLLAPANVSAFCDDYYNNMNITWSPYPDGRIQSHYIYFSTRSDISKSNFDPMYEQANLPMPVTGFSFLPQYNVTYYIFVTSNVLLDPVTMYYWESPPSKRIEYMCQN